MFDFIRHIMFTICERQRLLVYALCNFCSFIGGYRRNDEINKINHYKLAEIGKSYKEGLNIEEVELYKLYDDRYETNMPYQEGFEYIEYWMKNYYELPREIRFYWREMKE